MRKPISIFIGLSILLFAGGVARLESQEPSTPPSEVGLTKVGVDEVAIPDEVVANTTDPGDEPVITPLYEGSPPLIPHGIADFLPLAPDENACIDCHMVEEKVEGEPTPIPRSHYVDLRNAPDEVQEAPVGARFNCVACHVSQTSAMPLVKNVFGEEN